MTNYHSNTVSNDSMTFLDDDANSGFKFKDMVFFVLRNLHWFILGMVIGGVIAYYNVRGKERIYSSTATMLIKTTANSGSESLRGSTAISKITGQGLVVSTINNEMLVLKSQTNMENMVRQLKLNVMYSYTTKLAKRNKDLYKDAPFEVSYVDLDEQGTASFTVTALDDKYVLVNGLGQDLPSMKVKLNDTVVMPCGRVVITPTWRYGDFKGVEVLVRHLPVMAMANSYRGRIGVEREDEKNSVLKLTLNDTSPLRAADVLNTLIDVYNKESIEDQKRVLDYTEEFINERIDILMNNIHDYEKVSINFKQAHNIIDTKSYGQTYISTSMSSSEEEKQLEAQAGMIRYLINFVRDNEDQLVPVGVVALSDDATAAIRLYNENLMQLEKYKADGTMNNPVVQNLMESQPQLRSSIITLLENNLIPIQERITLANREKNVANSQIKNVPVMQLELDSVQRMQGIKEQLCLQLLTKREELLITTPQLEASAKVIDYAYPNYSPVAPNEKKSVTRGILIGLLC